MTDAGMSELFKYLDAFPRVWVRAEQRAEEARQARCEVLRMYDEQLGDVVSLYVFQSRVA